MKNPVSGSEIREKPSQNMKIDNLHTDCLKNGAIRAERRQVRRGRRRPPAGAWREGGGDFRSGGDPDQVLPVGRADRAVRHREKSLMAGRASRSRRATEEPDLGDGAGRLACPRVRPSHRSQHQCHRRFFLHHCAVVEHWAVVAVALWHCATGRAGSAISNSTCLNPFAAEVRSRNAADGR